jgi:hypothetical protein
MHVINRRKYSHIESLSHRIHRGFYVAKCRDTPPIPAGTSAGYFDPNRVGATSRRRGPADPEFAKNCFPEAQFLGTQGHQAPDIPKVPWSLGVAIYST